MQRAFLLVGLRPSGVRSFVHSFVYPITGRNCSATFVSSYSLQSECFLSHVYVPAILNWQRAPDRHVGMRSNMAVVCVCVCERVCVGV
jgi:hypothetical protein